jgi:hypothetical protein
VSAQQPLDESLEAHGPRRALPLLGFVMGTGLSLFLWAALAVALWMVAAYR